MRYILFLLPAFLLTSCAAHTSWAPVVDTYNNPNASRLSADLHECKQLALQASGGGATEAAKGGLLGAGLGAAAGAAIGAISGNPGIGAAYGATSGAVGGAASAGLSGEYEYKRVYSACLRNRGHTVLN